MFGFTVAILLLVLFIVLIVYIDKRRSEERKRKLKDIEAQIQEGLAHAKEKARTARQRKYDETAAVVLHEKLIVLDVETQYLSSEVAGGWDAVSEFLVSVAVTWDKTNGFRVWYEKDVPALLTELQQFAQIVTFNGERFDLKVLEHYGSIKELKKKSVDLLAFIKKHTRKRVSLDTLAEECLGIKKSMTGIEAVSPWNSGDPAKRQQVVDYCKKDVEILRDLYVELHAVCLRFPGAGFRTVRVWADGTHDSI